MDFKSMINKIESIDGPIETPKAPVLPAAVRLDEDTEFRVLAGLQPLTESLIIEKKLAKDEKVKKEEIHTPATTIAKKKAESSKNSKKKVDEDWPGTPEYKANHGTDKEKHMAKYGTDPEAAKEYEEKKKKGGYGNMGPSGSESDSEAPKKARKSKKDESLDPKFLAKFESMVEAKKKDITGKKAEDKMDEGEMPMTTVNGKKVPAFAADGKGKNDLGKGNDDGVPARADKKPGEDDNVGKKDGKKGMTAKQAKYFGKKKTNESQVDEFFYFDEPGSRSKKDRGPRDHSEDELARREKKGIKATDPDYKQKDDPRYGGRYKVAGPKGKLPESQRGSKKTVKESLEPKMSFRDMMKLVVESGGQQQIDPLDEELFAWATRIANHKLGEGTKSEVYAGLVYERMGGRFEMYTMLSETQK